MKICTNAVIFSRITIYAKWMTNSKLWVLLFKLYFWFFKYGMTGDSAGLGLVIICIDWVMGESANLNLCKLQLTVSFILLIITSHFVRWIYRISYYKKLVCLLCTPLWFSVCSFTVIDKEKPRVTSDYWCAS